MTQILVAMNAQLHTLEKPRLGTDSAETEVATALVLRFSTKSRRHSWRHPIAVLQQKELSDFLTNVFDALVAEAKSYPEAQQAFKEYFEAMRPSLEGCGFKTSTVISHINKTTRSKIDTHVKSVADTDADTDNKTLGDVYRIIHAPHMTNSTRAKKIGQELRKLFYSATEFRAEEAQKYLAILLNDKEIKKWHRAILMQFKKMAKENGASNRNDEYQQFINQLPNELPLKQKLKVFTALIEQAEKRAKHDEIWRAIPIAFFAVEASLMVNELIAEVQAEDSPADGASVFSDGLDDNVSQELAIFLINLGVGIVVAIGLVTYLFKTHHKYFVEHHMNQIENPELPKVEPLAQARLNYPLIALSLTHGVAFMLLANFTSDRFFDKTIEQMPWYITLVLTAAAVSLAFLSTKLDKVTEVRNLRKEDSQKIVDAQYENVILDWPTDLPTGVLVKPMTLAS